MQSGPGYIVEVDIVMNPDVTLRYAHDVSQLLQDKLELLPNVERAYVHVDYESTHAPVRLATLPRLSKLIQLNFWQEHRKKFQ